MLSEAEKYSDEWFAQQVALEEDLAARILPLLRDAIAQGLDHEGIDNAVQSATDQLRRG